MNNNSIVAITVSTNYSDLLPYILEANSKYFKKWIFVTDKNDLDTISQIPDDEKYKVLFFDFQEDNRVFNKGGAIRLAQDYAYNNYPEDWYLVLDSDTCLDESFEGMSDELRELDETGLYCCSTRKNYKSLMDYKKRSNYTIENMGDLMAGFFQLYKRQLYYPSSMDASKCDIFFSDGFKNKYMTDILTCHHLGDTNKNWKGRQLGSDFLIENK